MTAVPARLTTPDFVLWGGGLGVSSARAGGGGRSIGAASGIVGDGILNGAVFNSGAFGVGVGGGAGRASFGTGDGELFCVGGAASCVLGRVFTSRMGPNSTFTFWNVLPFAMSVSITPGGYVTFSSASQDVQTNSIPG